MKLSWTTDIHLNFLSARQRNEFYAELFNDNSDAVLVTGDISEAATLKQHLLEMQDKVCKPIYFVLGNHDYYRGDVKTVRKEAITLLSMGHTLHWLGHPEQYGWELDPSCSLVGVDGWADTRLGDFKNSTVRMSDHYLIKDFSKGKIGYPSDKHIQYKRKHLAKLDSIDLIKQLDGSVKYKDKIIIATHIPPFKEVALYMGKISGDDWLPFFTSKATGDILMKYAEEYPDKKFLVLCGHSHSEARYQPLPNLVVKCGSAMYGFPRIQETIDLDTIWDKEFK